MGFLFSEQVYIIRTGGFANQGRCPQNGRMVLWFLKVCGRMGLWIFSLSLDRVVSRLPERMVETEIWIFILSLCFVRFDFLYVTLLCNTDFLYVTLETIAEKL